jgi:hypothetical protein
MAIERKSIVDQIEIVRDGGVQVRFALLIVEDGKELSSAWHRTFIGAGDSPALQVAEVNKHLKQMGHAEVSNEDMLRVVAFHQLSVEKPSLNQRPVTE